MLLSRLGRQPEPGLPTARTRDVRRRAPAAESDPRQVHHQWKVAAEPAVKLAVREPGWYRVGQDELVAVGLDPAVDPRQLELIVDGTEQAILVSGEEDGSFDPGDAVEFYGSGLDTTWTDRRVYYLVPGSGMGKRIRTARADRPRGVAGPSLAHTVELKQRFLYFGGVNNGDAENVVTLTSQIPETYSLVDLVRLSYQHTYTADGDALTFLAPGRKKVRIHGFTGSDVRVFDVTDPVAVETLPACVERGASGYSATVIPGGRDLRTLIAFRESAVRQVAAGSADASRARPASAKDRIKPCVAST